MKRKTINKTLRKKLNHWIEQSGMDDKLQEKVRDNLLVSGGSIANLFMGEAPNDYDIYIQDIDVARELASFYCKPLHIGVLYGPEKEMYIEDYKKDRNASDYLFLDDKSAEAVRLRTLQPEQIKLEVNGGYEPTVDDPDKPYHVQFISPNAITLSDDIQIVTRFTGPPEEILANYDFIHATNYFTFKEGVVVNLKAMECLLTRELRYQGSQYPLTSVIRIKKFTNRGFTINAGEILKMLYQTSQLDLNNPDVLEEQLIGVDIAYFNTLINALRNVSREKRASEQYVFSMIDRIFNDE